MDLVAPGVEEMRALLSDSGLVMPPVPPVFARRFRKRDEWVFASRQVRTSPYDIEHYVRAARRPDHRDYVLLAHAGHGVNSYAIHYYLVHGPLRLFLQIGWGGAYMDAKATTRGVNQAFGFCHDLVSLLQAPAASGRGSRPELRRLNEQDLLL